MKIKIDNENNIIAIGDNLASISEPFFIVDNIPEEIILNIFNYKYFPETNNFILKE